MARSGVSVAVAVWCGSSAAMPRSISARMGPMSRCSAGVAADSATAARDSKSAPTSAFISLPAAIGAK